MKRRIFALLLTLALILTGFSTVRVAKADTANLLIDRKFSRVFEAEPGTTVHVKVPFMAVSNYAYNPIVVTTYGESSPFTTSNVKLTQNDQEAMLISSSDYTYVEFDVYMKDSAKIGNYDLGIQFTYDIFSGDSMQTQVEEHKLSIRVPSEKNPTQIAVSNINYDEGSAAIGNTFDLNFDVTNEGQIGALNTYLTIDYADTGLAPGYKVDNIKVGELKAGGKQKMTLPIKVLPTAKEGFTTLTAKFTYKDSDGKEYSVEKSIYVNIKSTSIASTDDASLVLGSSALNKEVLAGSETTLVGTIENIGNKSATNIKVTVPSGLGVESGIISNFSSDGIHLKDIAADSKTNFNIPLTVSKTAKAGLNEITVQVSFDDSKGENHTVVSKHYITVVSQGEEESTSEVSIFNVTQSPLEPKVGDIVTISFMVQNKGNKTVTDVKAGPKDLASSMGIEPITPEPEVSVGELKAGEKKNVTLQFKIANGVAEGLNQIKLGCSFKDSTGKAQNIETTVYILNVTNSGSSKPKLIVSDSSTDPEELRAGNEFNFTFDLKNTHSSKSARNIKVTITQKENVFSASKGTNSFYIEQIKPGETVTSTMPMKVKADTATGAYEISIAVEYEYDDMSKIDEEAGGVKEENILRLQAVENSRPVIENISVGMWEAATVNQSTTMSFEFYNMGKSTLTNVYFTFEGDFKLDTGEKYIQGSMEAGNSEFIEVSVVPLVEGMAKGTIVIHFEDSNGEEVTVSKEIPETFVQGQMMPEPGIDGGGEIPVIGGDVVVAKKDIVPLWAFILIQIAIVCVFIPVVRILVIKMHKRKLMKAEGNL